MSDETDIPRTLTDFNQRLICFLPAGFHMDDERWERIWTAYDAKGEALTSEDLKALFPDEASLKRVASGPIETLGRSPDTES